MSMLRLIWRELVGTAVVLATLALSHLFPWGVAPAPYWTSQAAPATQKPARPDEQPMEAPRTKGVRSGIQTLQLEIDDTRAPRRPGAGLL